jgi:hypothetical protein
MCKNFLILIIMLTSFTLLVYGQTESTWIKTYGGLSDDNGYDVRQTSDNGFIIVGETSSYGSGGYDCWLIKTDSDGDTLWTATYGGIKDDDGRSVQLSVDGGYIFTGVKSLIPFIEGNIWLIKTSVSGDTLWTNSYGKLDEDRGYSVYQTKDGGYIITGYTRPYGGMEIQPPNLILVKTDSNGDTTWTKTFAEDSESVGLSVQQTTDGGFIITGNIVSQNINQSDLWLIKTDSNGDTVWTKTFGSDNIDSGHSVIQTSDQGYIIVGYRDYISPSSNKMNLWLIKTDMNGDTVWTKTFGGTKYDRGYGVQQTFDGGYIITGYTSSFGNGSADVWLIKTDINGDSIWTRTFGGIYSDVGRSVQQTSDGGYIITGLTQSYGNGGFDVLLIKTNSEGVVSIESEIEIKPYEFFLNQNYPNPFNPNTTIEFSLPHSEYTTLKIYNILGEEIYTLVSQNLNAGIHKYNWDASRMPSGVYYYRLAAGNYADTKKLIFLK